MKKLVATVRAGRLVLNEPTRLPEGTEVPLLVDYDPGELHLTPAQRDELNDILTRSIAEADRGEGVPADEVLRRLRARA
jgi:hypothetical protein